MHQTPTCLFLLAVEAAVVPYGYGADCWCIRFLTYFYLVAQVVSGVAVFYTLKGSDGVEDGDEKDDTLSTSPTARRKLSIYSRVGETKVNPFVNRWELTLLDRIDLAITGSVLIPVRVPLFVGAVCAGSLLSKIICYKMPEGMTHTMPLSDNRRRALWLLSPIFRLILISLGFFNVEQKGKCADPKDAPIIVSNHITFVDGVPLTMACLPSPIAAYENLNMPLIGNIIRAMSTVTVDRTDKNSRHNTTEALKTRGRSNGQWPQILIFPEGTTHSDNSLITFKAGAFIAGVPVQPVVLKYGGWDPSWVSDGPPMPWILLRFMATPWNEMSVDYLPVYKPSDAEKKDAKLFANGVRAVMAAKMNVPVTAHSFEDIVMARKAAKLNLPVGGTVIEAPRLMKELHVDLEFLKKQMERFASIDKDGNGTIDFSEFCEVLSIPDSPFSRHYFSLMDVDDSGSLDFREFLLGLGILNSPTMATEAMAKTAFSILDVGETGIVALVDIAGVLSKIEPKGVEGVDCLDEPSLRTLMALEEGTNTVGWEQWNALMTTHPCIMVEYVKQVFGGPVA